MRTYRLLPLLLMTLAFHLPMATTLAQPSSNGQGEERTVAGTTQARQETNGAPSGIEAPDGQWGFHPITTPEDYDPERVKKATRCRGNTETMKYSCDPGAVYVMGGTSSRIYLTDLPETTYKVTASAGETWEFPSLNYDVVQKSNTEPFPRPIIVDLYLRRSLDPSYGGLFGTAKQALARLREVRKDHSVETGRLSLLLSGKRESAEITIYYREGEVERTIPVTVDLLHRRWWVQAGGFYAFVEAKDEAVRTASVEAEDGTQLKRVIRISSSHEIAARTGVQAAFFPGNYPWTGVVFGISDNEGRSPSYYLAPTIRLLGLNSRAVASLSFGAAAVPIRTFPGVDVGTELSENDPLLEGEVDYDIRPFLGVNIGFSFGGGV